jgi:hypothetical protein
MSALMLWSPIIAGLVLILCAVVTICRVVSQ